MQRSLQVSLAIRWCLASVVWAAIVGATAVSAGLAASAIALIAFGADSITDGLASAALVWRFGSERAGHDNVERIERRAARAVGAILITIGAFVSIGAIATLVRHSTPDHSTVGVALTAASVLVLPILARAKLRLAGALQSSALRGDGLLSLAGAALAAVTLVSLALNSALGWWWSDAAAALLIAAFLLREGCRTANRSRRLDG
jgi:divalent metal cation (Fe/Co/Zn/Cd) transporter